MRVTRSAALAAAVLLPTAATAWSGTAQASPTVAPGPNCAGDAQTKETANLAWDADPSVVVGKVDLQYSLHCRAIRAVIALNNPLPSGKSAFAAVTEYAYGWAEISPECHVAVGGSGCASQFVDDANQYDYEASGWLRTSAGYYEGHTAQY